MKEVIIFINHILENIKDIESFTTDLSKEDFFKNKEKQNAIIRSLEVIGEAVKNIPNEFRAQHPEVEWKEAAGTRDKIIHHYFGVNLETVWEIVTVNLPKLKQQMLKIKKEAEKQ